MLWKITAVIEVEDGTKIGPADLSTQLNRTGWDVKNVNVCPYPPAAFDVPLQSSYNEEDSNECEKCGQLIEAVTCPVCNSSAHLKSTSGFILEGLVIKESVYTDWQELTNGDPHSKLIWDIGDGRPLIHCNFENDDDEGEKTARASVKERFLIHLTQKS